MRMIPKFYYSYIALLILFTLDTLNEKKMAELKFGKSASKSIW